MCRGPVSPATTTLARRSTARRSSRSVGGASDTRPAGLPSTMARASSSSFGPQATSTAAPASSTRLRARSRNRATGQRLSGRPAPGLRTTSRSCGLRPVDARNSSTRASAPASVGSGNSAERGRTPRGSSSERYWSTTWRADGGGVTRWFVKSVLVDSRQYAAAKPIRSGARVAAVTTPLLTSPWRSIATSNRPAPRWRPSATTAPAASAMASAERTRRQPRVSMGTISLSAGLPRSTAASRRSTTQVRRACGRPARSAAATGSA